MRKLSIFLLFLFTFSAFTAGQPSSGKNSDQVSCLDRLRHFKPCADEIFGLIRSKQPISSSCCTAILDAAGECPNDLPFLLEEYCRLVKIYGNIFA
ncbi:hypothetical protein L484_003548 [Morus notabilis]|uniref:Prolamin-like domain-containing protein n=1 Tax=Morus notabilis TaxID=981085 RepID=W9RGQ1_9ROSA|nr:hypothetical protein L484_003548 [Morus notabilis]